MCSRSWRGVRAPNKAKKRYSIGVATTRPSPLPFTPLRLHRRRQSTMAAHPVLALRNLLRSVSPVPAQFASTHDPASIDGSSNSALVDHDSAQLASSSTHHLKRPASPSFEPQDEESRKRAKTAECVDVLEAISGAPLTNLAATTLSTQPTPSSALLDDLEQELLCGCCSALLYRPVIVYPCEHYFCGRFVCLS